MRKHKKNLYGWQKEAEIYFRYSPHPKQWFEFLGWLTTLSTLNLLTQKTNSIYINIILIVSYAIFFNYIQKKLWTITIQEYLPNVLSLKIKMIMTYLLSLILLICVYILCNKIVGDVVKGFNIK